MKRFITLLLCFFVLVACAGCESEEADVTNNSSKRDVSAIAKEKAALEIKEVEIDDSLIYYATIDIENYGIIKVELDTDEAPITVKNFVSLAESGFYDNLTFHRIIESFMMQGGDPEGKGTGGSNTNIEGEFALNGHSNSISHSRGVISMARSNDYNSASSQFFIMHADAPSLDGQYAAFGYVVEGMEVVDKVCTDAEPTDGNGTISTEEQPIIKTITISTAEKRDVDAVISEKEALEIEKIQIDENATYYATITVKDYGTIELKLDQQQAPITVANFVSLAKSGFYDGLTFHRIIDGFMIQGGDPEGKGTGGAKEEIVGEFKENGYENGISHERGVISMARATDYNSASSQFFIMQADSTGLDGKYAAFGYVTEGMEVVDKICEAANPTDSNGTIRASQQPIIESITIREE